MKEMSLIEHLDELRTRIIHIVAILVISFIGCYSFSDQIAEILLTPLRQALGGQGKIIYLGLFDKVIVQFQISFLSSIILSSPLWFRELWLFIRPALYEKEIKVIKPFIFVGFFMFLAGILFGYYVLFPFTFKTLLTLGVSNVEAYLSLKDYLILAVKTLVLLGFMFQLPNILVILGFMEVITKYTLRNLRGYIYVIFSILAAIITPTPDIFTMMMVWVPLILLYEIGVIAVALIVHPYLKRKYA